MLTSPRRGHKHLRIFKLFCIALLQLEFFGGSDRGQSGLLLLELVQLLKEDVAKTERGLGIGIRASEKRVPCELLGSRAAGRLFRKQTR